MSDKLDFSKRWISWIRGNALENDLSSLKWSLFSATHSWHILPCPGIYRTILNSLAVFNSPHISKDIITHFRMTQSLTVTFTAMLDSTRSPSTKIIREGLRVENFVTFQDEKNNPKMKKKNVGCIKAFRFLAVLSLRDVFFVVCRTVYFLFPHLHVSVSSTHVKFLFSLS